jgi:hypothetical protein
VSWRFEPIYNLAREKPDNMTHVRSQRPHEWPQLTMIIKESGRALPHPSACLPRDASTDIRGWPIHYPDVHPGGMVEYRLTRRPWKLPSLQGPISLVCARAQLTWSLIDTGMGYHLRSSEHEHRPLSTFSSSIFHFPLVALPGLILSLIPKAKSQKPHRTSIERKGPIASGFWPLIFYQ